MIPTSMDLLSCRPTPRDYPRVPKVLRGFNVKVAHKPVRAISNIHFLLKKPKYKIEKEVSRGVVYKIKCKDCDSVCVGQTSRAEKARLKEHTKALALICFQTKTELFCSGYGYRPHYNAENDHRKRSHSKTLSRVERFENDAF